MPGHDLFGPDPEPSLKASTALAIPSAVVMTSLFTQCSCGARGLKSVQMLTRANRKGTEVWLHSFLDLDLPREKIEVTQNVTLCRECF